ncbi:MAG: MBOAT family O-acyltransferase [Dongiaceae bacterium]
MVFSSIGFLFYFLPVFLLAYLLIPARNAVLLAFSLLFYAIGEGPFLLVLLGSILINYRLALLIEREGGGRRWITVGVIANLGLLGLFKYAAFVTGALGFAPVLIHLPLGISFFTFHGLSYLIDVQRGDARAERSRVDLALYIAMFPQLVAGPIVRFKTIVGELHRRRATTADIAAGIRLLAIGLAQKALLANTLARPVDAIFALPPGQVTAGVAWLGAIGYGLQLYYDFCGYSLMAMGLARMLGLHFPQNFDHPYASRSVGEFWRRWHITLSQWFRDYLYIPLGGNRRGPWRTCRNLLIVFLLCGLWHGAAWTFVAWGLWHGIFLVAERACRGWLPAWPWLRPLGHLYALLVVLVGWVLFRAADFSRAALLLRAMAGLEEAPRAAYTAAWFLTPETTAALVAGAIGAVPLVPWLAARAGRLGAGHAGLRHAGAAAAVAVPLCLVLLSAAAIAASGYNPFLYFRF